MPCVGRARPRPDKEVARVGEDARLRVTLSEVDARGRIVADAETRVDERPAADEREERQGRRTVATAVVTTVVVPPEDPTFPVWSEYAVEVLPLELCAVTATRSVSPASAERTP